MNKVVIEPSAASVAESKALAGLTPEQIAQRYVQLPMLPYGSRITIAKMAAMNFDFQRRTHLGILSYGDLRRVGSSSDFPLARDPALEYTDIEQVSPVTITTDAGVVYRVPQLRWFPLTDIVNGILIKQGRLLPVTVRLDDKNKWLVVLADILNDLKPQ